MKLRKSFAHGTHESWQTRFHIVPAVEKRNRRSKKRLASPSRVSGLRPTGPMAPEERGDTSPSVLQHGEPAVNYRQILQIHVSNERERERGISFSEKRESMSIMSMLFQLICVSSFTIMSIIVKPCLIYLSISIPRTQRGTAGCISYSQIRTQW